MKLFGTKRNAAHVAKKRGGKRKQDSDPVRAAREESPSRQDYVREERYDAPEVDYAAAVADAYEAEQDEVVRRPRRRGRMVRRLVIVLLIVVLAGGGGIYALMNHYSRPPEVPDWEPRPRPPIDNSYSSDPVQSGSSEFTREIFTVLIAGQDNVGTHGLTDVLMLAAINPGEGSVNLVSIPRDTKVNFGQGSKVNEVFPRSNGSTQRLMEEVENLVGFMPDFYVVVNLRAFGNLVDVLGGVHFNVPIRMQYSDPYDSPPLHINLAPGYQTLTGAQAMGLVRYRRTIGDLGRVANQQAFLRAVADELLQLSNVPRIPALVEIFVEHVDTDLPVRDMVYFALELARMGSEDIHFHTMYTEDAWIRGGSFQILVLDEWLELVNNYLNPFPEEVTTEHIRVHTRINGAIQLTGEGQSLTGPRPE